MKRKVNTKGSPTCGSSKAVKVPRLDSLSQINLNAAGLDVGDREIYACVPSGRTEQSVRVFPTFTADLNALAQWLRECQVTTVAMESTGVLDTYFPNPRILGIRGVSGQCPIHQKCHGQKDRHFRLSMDSTTAYLWTTA